MMSYQDLNAASSGPRKGSGEERCLRHDCSALKCAPTGEKYDSHECILKQCREWLSQCLDDNAGIHHMCHTPLVDGRFKNVRPARLIRVGEPGLGSRLVKFDSVEQDQAKCGSERYPDYVTLSYCWGGNGDKTHLLRAENEADFMLSLPSLPKTIQEAITICQRMGVNYIWVDALCIIQGHNDNSSDWEWQSARVGSYYANSLFTIAAAWADANDQGCLPICALSERNPHLMSRVAVRYRGNWPLLRRAWMTQELSLTARVLWIFDHCVEWSCSAGTFNHNGVTIGRSIFQVFRRELSSTAWYTLLCDYSVTDLTFDEDRLPALSGLCKYIDPNEEDQYAVGIWKQSMLFGVTWRSINTVEPNDNLPSWSPFSCGGQISYHFSQDVGVRCTADEDCDVCGPGRFKALEVDLETMYGDRHGKVKSAKLDVEAAVFAVRPHISSATEPSVSVLKLTDSEVSILGDHYWDTSCRTDWQIQAILVSHGRVDPGWRDSHGGICLFFLLLSQVERGVYRRVGLFVSSKLNPSDAVLEKVRAGQDINRIVLI